MDLEEPPEEELGDRPSSRSDPLALQVGDLFDPSVLACDDAYELASGDARDRAGAAPLEHLVDHGELGGPDGDAGFAVEHARKCVGSRVVLVEGHVQVVLS